MKAQLLQMTLPRLPGYSCYNSICLEDCEPSIKLFCYVFCNKDENVQLLSFQVRYNREFISSLFWIDIDLYFFKKLNEAKKGLDWLTNRHDRKKY